MTATTTLTELDRQVHTLVELGYPALAGMTVSDFEALFEPIKAACRDLPQVDEERVPFVVVVKRELVAPEQAMALTALKGKPGFADLAPEDLMRFQAIEELEVPAGPVYLLFDVDTGSDLRNVTPNDALVTIRDRSRTPLTIEEGIALITLFPEKLKKNHCFSLVGSRCGDRRVPALWISQGRPKLGWCWAGNPHTWLGSASCGGRGGASGAC